MARELNYLALEIGRHGAMLHRFSCATDAEEGARLIARLSPGVVAFTQRIDVTSGLCEPPDILVRYGDVPEDALGDPAEIAA